MILVNKNKSPKKLSDGLTAIEALEIAFISDKTVDKSVFCKSLKIDPKIYGDKTVKKALKDAQFNKCCFCEKDQVDEYGDVEHYRPKKGYKNSRAEKKIVKPGYYWLAYNWENLFFVCGKCNKSFKGNLFPLKDNSKRAKSHLNDISDEEPLLLNPSGTKDPRNHIYFFEQFPMYTDEYGQTTIDVCGLDRDELNNKRKKTINDIEIRVSIIYYSENFPEDKVIKAKQYLKKSISPESEFSAAAADYLKKLGVIIT